MRRTRRWIPMTAVVLALTAAACSDDSGGSDGGGSTGGSDADGAAVYAQACASCHGTDLRGTDRGPSHLSQVYEPGHHPDESFRSAITNGARAHHWNFGDMAPVAGLTDDEIDAVIAYIREQQELQGFEPYPPT